MNLALANFAAPTSHTVSTTIADAVDILSALSCNDNDNYDSLCVKACTFHRYQTAAVVDATSTLAFLEAIGGCTALINHS